MKKMIIHTEVKKMLSDLFTPVGIYLRIRDRFRDTILLESTDHHSAENSYSFICINAIGGIELSTGDKLEYKLPGQKPISALLANREKISEELWKFMQLFEVQIPNLKEGKFAQGLFGYTAYDSVSYFERIELAERKEDPFSIPLIRYRLYQYVIAINHHKDELFICENKIEGVESKIEQVVSLIKSKDAPVFPFNKVGEELSNLNNEEYVEMVKKGIARCKRGDVFQVVLSRRFQQQFSGDEFNVYRSLRSINPSPYLFFFDYGNYKLMGSSPEAQLVIKDGKAILHPIAGTFKRTEDEAANARMAEALLVDPKENAEHVMLVDLARNDLSRICTEVTVSQFKKIHYYSHVIHLVSEVMGKVGERQNPFDLIAKTFPAGTLSGAPKFKAMQIIDSYEPNTRGYYGGGIGFVGFDGSCNHAIMIRSFLSKQNNLVYQAGAGVVSVSVPENELQEVNNKLNALKIALTNAELI